MKGRSVCYVMPATMLRRPISELLRLQQGRRKLGLLIPTKKAEAKLHHRRALKGVHRHTYPLCHFPLLPYEWPLPTLRLLRETWRVLKQYEIIHVWGHYYANNYLLFLLSFFFPRRRIILTIDTLPGYSSSMGGVMDSLFKVYTMTLCKLLYWRANRITLYGRALLPAAAQSGIAREKIQVLPTGVAPLPKRGRAKLQGLKVGGRPIILFVGLLNSRKRPGAVLDVAKKFSKEQALFLIAGDGPAREELQQRIRREKLSHVKLLGWREDIPELLSAASLLLFPSSVEGLPGVVMEAMEIGTPVVTTKIPCTTDLIRDGKEGHLCPVDDVACMVRRVGQVLKEQKQRKQLVAAAQKRIRTHFSWKKVLPRYEKLYEAEA